MTTSAQGENTRPINAMFKKGVRVVSVTVAIRCLDSDCNFNSTGRHESLYQIAPDVAERAQER